jgi:hypothetical protein
VIFYLFRFLHQQLGASSKKAGIGFSRTGSVLNSIPRTIVRRILMEYLTSFPSHHGRLLLPLQSAVDIILQSLPIQLNLQQFSFALLVTSCRRVGMKTLPDQDKLSPLFARYLSPSPLSSILPSVLSSVLISLSLSLPLPPSLLCMNRFLEVLNEYCNQKDIFGIQTLLASHQHHQHPSSSLDTGAGDLTVNLQQMLFSSVPHPFLAPLLSPPATALTTICLFTPPSLPALPPFAG